MDTQVLEAVSAVVIALFGLLSAALTYVVIPFIRARSTREQRTVAYGIIESAVGMAEQLGRASGFDGRKKYELAQRWAQERFEATGLDYNEREVNGWIEDAVYQMQALMTEPDAPVTGPELITQEPPGHD